MAELDLDAIKARLAAATPGPWAIWHDLDHQGFTTVGDADSYAEILANGECEESNPTAHVYVEEDANLIAHAPADLAALVAEVERLEQEKAEAWDEGRHFGQTHDYAYPHDNPYKEAP